MDCRSINRFEDAKLNSKGTMAIYLLRDLLTTFQLALLMLHQHFLRGMTPILHQRVYYLSTLWNDELLC